MLSQNLTFFTKLAKAQTVLSRRFDNSLAGLSLNEFIVMLQLKAAKDGRIRPLDLAEKVGLTPSGITRLLRPMEKVGYIRRQAASHDARISYVVLGRGGADKLETALENAELLADELLEGQRATEVVKLSDILERIAS